MAQDPSPGSRAGAVKTNTLPLFKQSPGKPFPGRNRAQVPRPGRRHTPARGNDGRTAARTKVVITSAFLVSGSGEFSRANTSGSHFEEERRVSEASVFQALQKRRARHTRHRTCSFWFSFPAGLGWTRDQALDSTKASATGCFAWSRKYLAETVTSPPRPKLIFC